MHEVVIPYGMETVAGRYTCADCGMTIRIVVNTALPQCPNYNLKTHKLRGWLGNSKTKNDKKN